MSCECGRKYTVQTENGQVEVKADDVNVPSESFNPLVFYRGRDVVASFSDWTWFKQEG